MIAIFSLSIQSRVHCQYLERGFIRNTYTLNVCQMWCSSWCSSFHSRTNAIRYYSSGTNKRSRRIKPQIVVLIMLTYIMHTKDAINKKIKIFKFSLALYQILFRMYSRLCKKHLVLVGSKCTIIELSSQLADKPDVSGEYSNICSLARKLKLGSIISPSFNFLYIHQNSPKSISAGASPQTLQGAHSAYNAPHTPNCWRGRIGG